MGPYLETARAVTIFLEHILNLAWLGLVCLIATVIGRRFCRMVGWRLPTLMERGVLAAGLGFASLAYLVWIVGVIGLLTPAVLWSILLVLFIVGLPEWPDGWRIANAVIRGRKWRHYGAVVLVLAGIALVQTVLIVLKNLAPPTAADPLFYHLTVPRQYLYEGRIVWWPIFGWNFPQLTEMLYMLGLGTSGDVAAGSIGSALAILCGVTVWCLARRYVSLIGAWLATVLVMTLPLFYEYATNVKVEMALSVFLLLGWLALLHWYEGHGQRWLVLAGLCAGLAASTKYQALLGIGGLGVAVCFAIFLQRRRLRMEKYQLLGSIGLALAVAIVVMLPWYGRNWLLGGDPVWPLGFPIFKSRYYTAEEFQKFANWTLGTGSSIISFLISPWMLTTRTSAFGSHDFRAIFTPAFLAFLPGLLLVWHKFSLQQRRAITLLLIGIGSSYSVWFLGGYQKLGYLFPMLIPLMVVTVLAVEGIWQHGKALQAVSVVGLTIALMLSLAVAVFQTLPVAPYLIGRVNRDDYLRSKVSCYDVFKWANEHLPSDAKVLSLDLHPYYLERRLILGAPAYSGVLGYPTLRSSQELLARLQREGITHILAPGRALDEGFAKASRELWPGTHLGDLVKSLIKAGRIVEIYHNPAARIIKSRTFGWEGKEEYYIYEVRYT